MEYRVLMNQEDGLYLVESYDGHVVACGLTFEDALLVCEMMGAR